VRGDMRMKVESRFLQFCAERTADIVREYQASYGSDDELFWRSADELELLIKALQGKQIYCKSNRIPKLKAKYRAYTVFETDGTYTIIFVAGLDDKEIKYFKTKELFQIVLQQDAFRTRDLVDHITKMVEREGPGNRDLLLGHTATAETLAELAAEEFLFPLSHRQKFLADGGDPTNVGPLSDQYGIPDYIIQTCLSKELIETLGEFF